MSLAKLVRAWRERALLSQEELAQRSGLSVGTVRGLESGRISRPRGASIRLLADALGLSEQDRGRLASLARAPQAQASPDGPAQASPDGQARGEHGGDGAAGSPGGVPAQLPAAVSGFAGRAEALKALDELLSAKGSRPVVIATIAGMAGVGKTALAVWWAHSVADRFHDGQLYIDLRGFDAGGQTMDPAEAVRLFLEALQVPPQRIPATLDGQAALYRSLLASRRMLILLDNARDAEQVRPLLPGAPGCLVLVTSRDQLPGLVAAQGARPLMLEVLTRAESRQLLRQRLGADRIAAEPRAVEEIVLRCARLPLALAVAAARAATHPGLSLALLADELRAAEPGLDAFAGRDPVVDVRSVFSWSYRALEPDAARLFRMLGLPAGPDITAPAAASLAGIPPGHASTLLSRLASAHLIAEQGCGRFGMHDLLRAYAVELVQEVDGADDRGATLLRMFDHYLHTAFGAAVLLNPVRKPIDLAPAAPGTVHVRLSNYDEAMAWLAAEHHVLVAAVRLAADSGFDTHAWQLPWALTSFLDRRGHWHDWLAVQRIAVTAAERLGDHTGQAHARRALAGAHHRLGREADAQAHLTQALELFVATGDPRGEAECRLTLCQVHERQQEFRIALAHGRRALGLFEAIGDATGQAAGLGMVGWLHAIAGEPELGVGYCERAVALNESLGNTYGQAQSLRNLGYAHQHLGRHDDAADCYERAIALFRGLGDQYHEAVTLTALGDTHQAAGEPSAATKAWRHALRILDALGHPDAATARARLRSVPNP